MAAAPIEWTKDDILRLKQYPDFPWVFMPYKLVKPDNFYTNHTEGDAAPRIHASTDFKNVPPGFCPVSPVYRIEQQKSDVLSRELDDDTLVPFIADDKRFSYTAPFPYDRSNTPSGAVQAWGCQTDADKGPYQGIRLIKPRPSKDFCALGDQQVPGGVFWPSDICNKAFGKPHTSYYPTSYPKISCVHRHLVEWSRDPSVKWVPEKDGDVMKKHGQHTLHGEPLIRLNKSMAIFRVDWLNEDGTYARPLTLRTILQMSIDRDDSQVILRDGFKLQKSLDYIVATQENAVKAYRDHHCKYYPDDPECACFKPPPPDAGPWYVPACHNGRCTARGYKLAADEAAMNNCKQLNVQICKQNLDAHGNKNMKISAEMQQQCNMMINGESQKTTNTKTTPGQSTKAVSRAWIYALVAMAVVIICVTAWAFQSWGRLGA